MLLLLCFVLFFIAAIIIMHRYGSRSDEPVLDRLAIHRRQNRHDEDPQITRVEPNPSPCFRPSITNAILKYRPFGGGSFQGIR